MAPVHTFSRPKTLPETRHVGVRWSPEHSCYDEGARYVCRDGAHELTFGLTGAGVNGFWFKPGEVRLHVQGAAAFLLYKIQDVCEWSDVAFNVHLVPEAERALPQEAVSDRARLRLTLVDAGDGIVRAKRIVSLDKVIT